MALPEIVIGSKLDARGFKAAESASEKLGKSVKKLAAAFGLAFSAQKLMAFGKASVKAFVEDDQAAARLTKTLGNLGLAFEDKRLKGYVSQLEASSGVLDAELRPALQTLLTTTGSVTKSQELLGLSIDMARGSGESLATTSYDIAQAFVGNVKGLKKYNLGLTQTELQTTSFLNLQEKLNEQFTGQNAAYLDTYAGKVSLLKVAYDNMQESIGKGLVESFMLLAGDNGIGGATDAMQKFGDEIGYALVGATDLLTKLTEINTSKNKEIILNGQKYSPVPSALEQLSGRGKRVTGANKQYGGIYATNFQRLQSMADDKARAEAEAKAVRRAKELQAIEKKRLDNLKKIAAEAAKKAALDKLSAFLTQAQKVFDMDRIQLAAAALGKLTEEDKVRVRLKQEIMDLEDAINAGNIEGAAKLASAVAKDAELLGMLRGDMIKLGDVPNPFAEWLQTLLAIAAQLAALANIPVVLPMTGGFVPGTTPGQTGIPGMGGMASPGFGMGGWTEAIPPAYTPGAIPGAGRGFSMASVTVNVQGSISTERDIVAAITEGIYNNQAAGTPITYSTVY